MRSAIVLIAVLVVAQVIGSGRLGATECRDNCTDDDEDGQCPPTCSDCSCCTHLTPLVTPLLQVVGPAPVTEILIGVEPAIPHSIDPRDILHVPKPLSS